MCTITSNLIKNKQLKNVHKDKTDKVGYKMLLFLNSNQFDFFRPQSPRAKMRLIVLLASIALAVADDTPIQEFTAGNRLFTTDVYNQLLVDNKQNILVSPFSAETVLALTEAGAQGDTAKEIRTTLHLADTEEETENEFKSVLPTIHSDYVSVVTANKVYVENNFPIKDGFKTVASDVYQAEFQNIEFGLQQEAADEINDWVAEHTNNKIQNLVSPGDLGDDTKIVLVNALYFQGNWSQPFNILSTRKTKFYTSADTTVDSEAMFTSASLYHYAESEELDAKILEIPFKGGEAAMTFVLPNQKEGIAILEKKIGNVLVKPEYTAEMVQVQLPKFKIESTIDFKQLLEQLGVHKAFDFFQADFSGIAGVPGQLFISQIKQKTYIDVNEGGVEAAAATEVGGITSVEPSAVKFFIADHPFVFYITIQDIVLFEGRVLVPEYY